MMEACLRDVEARKKGLHYSNVDNLSTIIIKAVRNYKPLERQKFVT